MQVLVALDGIESVDTQAPRADPRASLVFRETHKAIKSKEHDRGEETSQELKHRDWREGWNYEVGTRSGDKGSIMEWRKEVAQGEAVHTMVSKIVESYHTCLDFLVAITQSPGGLGWGAKFATILHGYQS